jgi:hypothetical protein
LIEAVPFKVAIAKPSYVLSATLIPLMVKTAGVILALRFVGCSKV